LHIAEKVVTFTSAEIIIMAARWCTLSWQLLSFMSLCIHCQLHGATQGR